MYKVVLVDDEPLTFIGLRNVFKWEEAGFEIIAQTTNPYEALDVIISRKPDVVFTDVRMPGISGLEIIKKVRELGLDTEFVIISGFAEFTYAQEALRHGAFDYCLKPVKIDRENLFLKRLSSHLQHKKKYKDLGIFEELMENKISISHYLEQAGIQACHKYFQVVTAVYATPRDYKKLKIPGEKMSLFLSPRKYFSLVNAENALDPHIMLPYCLCCSVGISQVAEGAACLYSVYRQADMAVCNEFIYKKKGIYCYKPSNISFINKLASIIEDEIESKRIKELKNIFDGLHDTFIKNELCIEDAVYLWNRIVAYVARLAEDKNTCLDFGFMEYEEILDRFDEFEDYSTVLFELARSLISADATRSGYCNESFEKLLEYVEAHYTERLFLKSLASEFYINLSYCCELFKKIKGCTFSEYVTGLRMKKAGELLRKGKLTITEVANAVGYNDYFYFNRVFSKYYGVSPAKYMRNCQGIARE